MDFTEEEKERWKLFRSNPYKRGVTDKTMEEIKLAIVRGDTNRSLVDEFGITMSVVTRAKKEIGFVHPAGRKAVVH